MIAIVNYGVGNILSLRNFLMRFDDCVVVTDDPDLVETAKLVVLPGVGSFGPAMQRLKETGLEEVLKLRRSAGFPILGICLGMQLMFGTSTEAPGVEGLGWFSGTVHEFSADLISPHMGWNSVSTGEWVYDFYFVHSYKVSTDDQALEIAYALYEQPFPAIVQNGNICGVQFHPEISSTAGINLMKKLMEEWQI